MYTKKIDLWKKSQYNILIISLNNKFRVILLNKSIKKFLNSPCIHGTK